MATNRRLLIAGGGIAGLAASLAVARAGTNWAVCLMERADAFAEVGAGIQIGPNVTRILHGWGLEAALRQVAAYPSRLLVRDARSGAQLGALRLGNRTRTRYGAPYATIHRADLHGLLAVHAQAATGTECRLGQTVAGFADDGHAIAVQTTGNGHGGENGNTLTGDALIGADGVRSPVRQQLLADGSPRFTGHVAYRAMLAQAALPAALRSLDVTAWLGPHLHIVHYPVRGGDWLNVVAIVEGDLATPPGQPGPFDAPSGTPLDDWDHAAQHDALQHAIAARGQCCAPLADLIAAAPQATVNPYAWRLWALAGRPPVRGPSGMAHGRVALAGDAAHPTLPYLAQGACMAIEDAAELARCLTADTGDIPQRLARYANTRWQRCAHIQQRSTRNGRIFHATGALRLARDAAMRAFGESLIDLPWLYGYGM